MVAFNDDPEIEFRRPSTPLRMVPPTRTHGEDKPSQITPTLLFLLSLVIPGLGQLFLGFFAQAIAFFVFAAGFWYAAYAGIDALWPLLIVHFLSAFGAFAACNRKEILKDISHLFPSGSVGRPI